MRVCDSHTRTEIYTYASAITKKRTPLKHMVISKSGHFHKTKVAVNAGGIAGSISASPTLLRMNGSEFFFVIFFFSSDRTYSAVWWLQYDHKFAHFMNHDVYVVHEFKYFLVWFFGGCFFYYIFNLRRPSGNV